MVDTFKSTLNRREVVKRILADRNNLLVVSGLGSSTYDVHAAGDNDKNFYLWGGMGGTAMIGLGLAIARPEKSIIVFTGDGDLLMGVGSLATISVQKPKNLMIVVLDNEHFGETGMQKSHTFYNVDLVGVAVASGCPNALLVTDENDLVNLIKVRKTLSCFTFAVIKVSKESELRSLPLVNGSEIKTRFKRSIDL
mgnify:CR=1 FL=1